MNKLNIIICIFLIILFLGCFLKMPYAYFEIIRFFGMIGFIILAYGENKYSKNKLWIVIWISSAILINPFFKLALGRKLWNVIDGIWITILILNIVIQSKQYKNHL